MKHAYRILDPATGLPTETPSYGGVPSAEAISEIAGPVGVVAAVATGWVPVSSAEALAAEMRAKGVKHHKLAVAARRRGAYSVNARHRAASSALLLYAYKLRRIVEYTTVRQPAPNTSGLPPEGRRAP